jgi:MoaA/NifB/PqqE/SkfB family radical SAM enzyme
MPDAAINALLLGAHALERVPPARRLIAGLAERRLRANAERPGTPLRHPPAVQQDKLAVGLALLNTLERALERRRLSPAALRCFVKVLYRDVLLKRGDASPKARFHARFGCNPPDFLVISPGRACNLRCEGCYANAAGGGDSLPFETLERIVEEARTGWGSRFFVISGGEPFAYRRKGLGLIDLAERHPDCYFISYTNGTLIDDATAARMAALGNLSPALSIEGGRERTDARRGEGVYDAVLAAARRLRREGVAFGLSLTATSENAAEVLADDVFELFFDELGALYAWVFHYMPMGRAPSLALMPSAEQRVALWRQLWHLVRDRRYFIADFWNSGTVTNGCIAGGRPGGYFHVDWSGNACPCVFVPYAAANVKEVFAAGGSLDDVWSAAFFREIRAWQRANGYREHGEACPSETGNWLAPCLIRDHHAEFREIVAQTGPRAVDAGAQASLDDPDYAAGLIAFDRELRSLTDPIWSERYLGR